MRVVRILTVVLAAALLATPAWAQFDEPPNEDQLGEAVVQKLKVGLIVQAVGGPCVGLYGTAPVPTDWSEQAVRIVDEEVSPSVRKLSYRTLAGGVKQMVVTIPRLEAGQTAKALITFEIRRRPTLALKDTSAFVLPTEMPLEVRRYLAPSPYIESHHAKIRTLAKEVIQGKETAWEQVEAIYDWVRENIEYKNGKLKGAMAALKDGDGDCEELTSLFIAMCRANNIPARTVWVPGHCYPEFYLVDGEGVGQWIPCQAAVRREFGSMSDDRPILQKGDNFKVPERREAVRYVPEFLKGKAVRGSGNPQVHFIREKIEVE